MIIKKIKVPNSRFFYIPHSGESNWTNSLGLLQNKMDKDTPFIAANRFYQIFVQTAQKWLVGRDVVGPIRQDLTGIFLADFKMGEVESLEIKNLNLTFAEIFDQAKEILSKRDDLNRIFSIRVAQDPLGSPMELRFFPNNYLIPKLTF
jgi:hypothetical protein